MSRQTQRDFARAVEKSVTSKAKQEARTKAKRALLERQTTRENAGAYDDRLPVSAMIAPSRSRVSTRKVQKGKPFGRIIRTLVTGREFMLHATKGWRSYVIAA